MTLKILYSTWRFGLLFYGQLGKPRNTSMGVIALQSQNFSTHTRNVFTDIQSHTHNNKHKTTQTSTSLSCLQ